MNRFFDGLLRIIQGISKTVWVGVIAIVLLAVGIFCFFPWKEKLKTVNPIQIQSIKDIGQWEFLSISNEELVDTVSKNMFGDDELARIYYGTVRIGIDLKQAKPKWIRTEGDSVVTATLPPVGLLDRDFIDETRTKPFYEDGKWSPEDRESLYNKAYRKMIARCLTKENIATAEQNARQQFTQLFKAMGFAKVNIEFEKEKK